MSTNNGRFVWYEYLAKDPKQAIAFYTDVVGWTTQPFAEGGGDYTMWVGSQGPLGGVMALPEEAAKMGAPPSWITHVQVADVDATVAKVVKLGGRVHKTPEDIPNVGRFAVIADPQGASICVFHPNSEMTLHDSTKPQEFCWHELITSDNEAAFRFYSEVFGWKVLNDMDMGAMGVYRIFGVDDKQLGGMMKAPPGSPIPPMWMFYIETSNLETSITRANAKGARLINGPMDVPGGRIAQYMDPQGAAFNIHQLVK